MIIKITTLIKIKILDLPNLDKIIKNFKKHFNNSINVINKKSTFLNKNSKKANKNKKFYCNGKARISINNFSIILNTNKNCKKWSK